MTMTASPQHPIRLRAAARRASGLLIFSLCLAAAGAGSAWADKVPSPPSAPPAAAPAADPAAAPAVAAPAAAPTASVPDKDGFVPESRPPAMNNVEAGLPAAPLVGAAYGFIWLAVFGFVVWTLRRTTQLEADIAELRERIARAQGSSK